MANKTKDKEVKKEKIELSCRETKLILRVIPLRKNAKDMKEEEIAAVGHYLYCESCRNFGLAEILDTKLPCKDVLLVWAERPGALWLNFGPLSVQLETLIEEYAVEHVWGKYQWKNKMGGYGYDNFTACRKQSCQALRSYWYDVPMSTMAGDGAEGVIHELPFFLEIFLKEKWPLDRFFEIQRKRMRQVIKDIKSGNISVSQNHYHSTDELAQEVQANIDALQKLFMSTQV